MDQSTSPNAECPRLKQTRITVKVRVEVRFGFKAGVGHEDYG